MKRKKKRSTIKKKKWRMAQHAKEHAKATLDAQKSGREDVQND